MDIVIVTKGPRAGIWFRNDLELERFKRHPLVRGVRVVNPVDAVLTTGYGLEFRVAPPAVWRELEGGYLVLQRDTNERTHIDDSRGCTYRV